MFFVDLDIVLLKNKLFKLTKATFVIYSQPIFNKKYLTANFDDPPWNFVDIRNLKSNEIKDLVEKISKLNNVMIYISSKQEIVHLDKLVSSLNNQMQFHEIRIFFDDETFEELVLHLLFITLTSEHFKVSLMLFKNIYTDLFFFKYFFRSFKSKLGVPTVYKFEENKNVHTNDKLFQFTVF